MVILKVLHKRFDEGSLRSFPDLVARQMVTLNRRESAKKKGMPILLLFFGGHMVREA